MNLKYAVLQGNYWMLYCSVFGYVSVFLLSRDFSAGSIGVLTAAANVVAAVVQTSVAGYADRTDRFTLKDFILLFTCVGAVPLILLIMLPHMASVTAGLFILVMTMVNVMMPLINSICGYYQSRGYEMNFGLARGIGSLSFAAVSYLLGYLIKQFGETSILVTALVLFCAMILVLNTFRMKRGRGDAPVTVKETHAVADGAEERRAVSESRAGEKRAVAESGAEEKRAVAENGAEEKRAVAENGAGIAAMYGTPSSDGDRRPFHQKYGSFLCMLVGIALLFTFHNMVNTYLIHIMGQFGGDSADMGLSIALAAVCELPAMFLFSRIVKRVPANRLLIFSAFGYVVKAVVIGLAGSVLFVNISQLFQSISFALYTPASVHYADEVMEPGDRVKGQAFITAAVTLGGVAGNLSGGWVIDAAGVHAMMVAGFFCALAGFVIVCFTAKAAGDRRLISEEAK